MYFRATARTMTAKIILIYKAGMNFWNRAPQYIPASPPTPKDAPRSQSGATDKFVEA